MGFVRIARSVAVILLLWCFFAALIALEAGAWPRTWRGGAALILVGPLLYVILQALGEAAFALAGRMAPLQALERRTAAKRFSLLRVGAGVAGALLIGLIVWTFGKLAGGLPGAQTISGAVTRFMEANYR